MVRAREERKSQDMVVMGAEREGDVFFWYDGMETGDTQVVG